MKKSILWLGLCLGLLVTHEGVKADHPCNPDGNCYIHNAAENQLFFFDKNKQPIGSLVSGKVLAIKDDLFPVEVTEHSVFAQGDVVLILDAHCYVIWDVMGGEKYWTTRWLCSLKNPGLPSKEPTPQKAPKKGPPPNK